MALAKKLGLLALTGALALGLSACSGGNIEENKQEAPAQEEAETEQEVASEIDVEKEIIGVWEASDGSGQLSFNGNILLMDSGIESVPAIPYTMTVDGNKATVDLDDYNMTIEAEFTSADTAMMTITSGGSPSDPTEFKKIDSNPDKTTVGSVVHLSLGEPYEDENMSIQIDSLDFLDEIQYDVYVKTPSDGAKSMAVQGKLKNMSNNDWYLQQMNLPGIIVINNKHALPTDYLCSAEGGLSLAPMNSADFTACTDISPDEIDNIESATLYLCFANLFEGGKTFVVNLK